MVCDEQRAATDASLHQLQCRNLTELDLHVSSHHSRSVFYTTAPCICRSLPDRWADSCCVIYHSEHCCLIWGACAASLHHDVTLTKLMQAWSLSVRRIWLFAFRPELRCYSIDANWVFSYRSVCIELTEQWSLLLFLSQSLCSLHICSFPSSAHQMPLFAFLKSLGLVALHSCSPCTH